MSILKNKRCYLSGPIEHDTSGLNWRVEPIRVLTEEFGINVFDPFDDPKQVSAPSLIQARNSRNFSEMTRIARQFVRKDLAMVDRSDLVIARLKRNIPTCGTFHEIINCCNAKKPCLIVCEDGKQHINAWLYGFIDYETGMFDSWDDLYHFLRNVEEGSMKHHERWQFIYGMI